MAATVSTGTTAVLGTSAFAPPLLSVGWNGITRPALKSSHMGTTLDDTFITGSLVDNGEISLEFLFQGNNSPPIITNHAAETLTINWGGVGASNTWAASVIMTGWEMTATLEELMVATGTFKCTGAITVS